MSLLRRTLAACLLLGLSSVALAGGQARPLIEPDPVAVPAGTDVVKVAKAIKLALLVRDWVVSNEKAGYMEATLLVRKHMVKVGITYDQKLVTIKYLDSAEMNYVERESGPFIHPQYTNWTRNVLSDLEKFFQHPDLF